MHRRQVLIIDDDEVVQGLIHRTVANIDPDLEIAVYSDPAPGIQYLNERQVDVVISDLAHLAQDGDRLYNAIRSSKGAVALIATARASTDLADLTARFQILQLLYKPIDISQMNQVLTDVFRTKKKIRLDHFQLSKITFEKINVELASLRESTNARCILVSDTYGRVLITAGDTEGLPIDAITSLLGGGVATLLEAGSSLDDGEVINLAYREGKKTDLYAVNIGLQLLLILVIDRGLFYNRLGTVWFYTRQTVINLSKTLQDAETEQPGSVGNPNMNQAYSEELDRLFKEP